MGGNLVLKMSFEERDMANEDSVLAFLKKHKLTLSLANYLHIAFQGRPPESLEEIEIPVEVLRFEKKANKDLTTEQLMDAALATIQQMSDDEKAKLREDLMLHLGSQIVFRKDTPAEAEARLLRMPVSEWKN
jgi:hypothetical protein